MKNNFLYYLGNFLIIASLLSSAVIYLPLLFPAKATIPSPEVILKGNTVEIPKIQAYAEIVLDVDPWIETEYLAALNKGVAHAKGTAYPWEDKGVSFLFAHSSLPPWSMTRTNVPFLYLSKLATGDLILVRHNGVTYKYGVVEKKEVWPSEVKEVFDRDENLLILQTCTPLGTSLKRLLIFAKKM